MDQLQRLGRRLSDVQRDVKKLQKGVGLGFSSFDEGAITQNTPDGTPGAVFGQQQDGSNGVFAVTGPTPPTPVLTTEYSNVTLEGLVGGIRVRWEGHFAGGLTVPAPMGFTSVEVHVGDTPDFSGILFETLRTNITSPRGGDVLMPMPVNEGGYWVKLVCRTASGQASLASPAYGPVFPRAVSREDLGFSIDDLAGNTITRGPDQPTGDHRFGDLWLLEPDNTPFQWTPASAGGGEWVEVQDAGVVDAINAAIDAQEAADSKSKVWPTSATAPTGLAAVDAGDLWWKLETDSSVTPYIWDGTTWAIRQIGNAAVKPASLVASTVVATGSITAALLQAILVLASTIIAGDPAGTHAKMDPRGFHVYRPDEDNPANAPLEVIKLGTADDDFFGVIDQDGVLVASIDSTGAVNGRVGNFRDDIIVGGVPLSASLKKNSGTILSQYHDHFGSDVYPIQSEIGIVEVNGMLDSSRVYELRWTVTWFADNYPTEAVFQVRSVGPNGVGSDQTNGAPTINSLSEQSWNKPQSAATYWNTDEGTVRIYPSVSGRHRFALTVARGAGTGSIGIKGNRWVDLLLVDAGPRPPSVGNRTPAGGQLFGGAPPTTPPNPVQQYLFESGPTSWATYRGSGAQRGDTTDVVQGWDPAGVNGDGQGFWWYNLPDIHGTVDRVDIYLYSNHWYYNGGGSALINISPQFGPAFNPTKLRTNWQVDGWARGAGRWLTVPSDWWPFFRTNQPAGSIATAITLGPGGGSNLSFYGRFNGPDFRVKVWYTQ